MSLSSDLKKFEKMASEKQERVVKASFIHLGTEMELKSPVDTGRFKANWMPNLNSIDSSTTDSTASNIGAIAVELGGFKIGQTYYYTNSLPYAMALEFGHSNQAPQGFVRLAARRWDKIVAAEIRAVQ